MVVEDAMSRWLIAVAAGAMSVAVAAAQDAATRGPAPSLVRPTASAKAPGADGFLQRWLILEPIATNGQLTDSAVQAAVKTLAVPTRPTTIPRHGDKVTIGDAQLAWHAVDTIRYNVNSITSRTR